MRLPSTSGMECPTAPRVDAGDTRTRAQCGGFTGIIPVLALFLIKFEWYWYLVFEVVFEVF